jgi:hypothetical protein
MSYDEFCQLSWGKSVRPPGRVQHAMPRLSPM